MKFKELEVGDVYTYQHGFRGEFVKISPRSVVAMSQVKKGRGWRQPEEANALVVRHRWIALLAYEHCYKYPSAR